MLKEIKVEGVFILNDIIDMYPDKYIVVRNLDKLEDMGSAKGALLAVGDTLDDCCNYVEEKNIIFETTILTGAEFYKGIGALWTVDE
jgi:hypothetical protein